jgi:hypothetical protein
MPPTASIPEATRIAIPGSGTVAGSLSQPFARLLLLSQPCWLASALASAGASSVTLKIVASRRLFIMCSRCEVPKGCGFSIIPRRQFSSFGTNGTSRVKAFVICFYEWQATILSLKFCRFPPGPFPDSSRLHLSWYAPAWTFCAGLITNANLGFTLG